MPGANSEERRVKRVDATTIDERIEALSKTYEEAKDCVHKMDYFVEHNGQPNHKTRLYELLAEMRDTAAVAIKNEAKNVFP